MADGNSPLRLSAQEFLDWEEQQETKHELVDGKVYAMAGAKNRHEKIKKNLIAFLDRSLPANGPCEPFGSDTKIAIPNSNYRYPDLVIDCTQARDLDSAFSETPTVIFEILSPSNRWYDRATKIADYQLLTECRHIIIVWSTALRIEILSRMADESWARSAEVYEGRDAQVVLGALDIKIPLEDVFRGFADADLPD
jgi:Uma2 family endonuclease